MLVLAAAAAPASRPPFRCPVCCASPLLHLQPRMSALPAHMLPPSHATHPPTHPCRRSTSLATAASARWVANLWRHPWCSTGTRMQLWQQTKRRSRPRASRWPAAPPAEGASQRHVPVPLYVYASCFMSSCCLCLATALLCCCNADANEVVSEVGVVRHEGKCLVGPGADGSRGSAGGLHGFQCTDPASTLSRFQLIHSVPAVPPSLSLCSTEPQATAVMSTQGKARGPPDMEAGTFQTTQEHLASEGGFPAPTQCMSPRRVGSAGRQRWRQPEHARQRPAGTCLPAQGCQPLLLIMPLPTCHPDHSDKCRWRGPHLQGCGRRAWKWGKGALWDD